MTFVDGRSMFYWWNRDGFLQFADENFAREIMQLFTIGLYELNSDGTRRVDSNGDFIRAYTNDHIKEYARVYTGFRRRKVRGNIETNNLKEHYNNYIDPMFIEMSYADILPKVRIRNCILC